MYHFLKFLQSDWYDYKPHKLVGVGSNPKLLNLECFSLDEIENEIGLSNKIEFSQFDFFFDHEWPCMMNRIWLKLYPKLCPEDLDKSWIIQDKDQGWKTVHSQWTVVNGVFINRDTILQFHILHISPSTNIRFCKHSPHASKLC